MKKGKNKNKSTVFNAAFNKPAPVTEKNTDSGKKTRRAVIIATSILVGLAIILGAVLGTVSIIKNASYLIKLESVGISEGVANYFVTEFKAEYVRTQKLASNQLFVSDEAAFWKSAGLSGPQSEYLKFYIEKSMKELVAANVLFERYAKLDADDKNEIAMTISSIVSYRANGSKAEFNKMAEKYGFDYEDFKDAIELLYKANTVAEKIFGSDGSAVMNFPDFVNEFFAGYRRAKIVFIRTADTFVLDESGNRVKDENGFDELRILGENEIAERVDYINKLDACIAGIKDGSVAVERYDELVHEIYTKYGENINTAEDGYYFLSNEYVSTFTSEFSEKFESVVSKVYSLEIGEAAYVEYGSLMSRDGEEEDAQPFVGRAYIMRLANENNAYSAKDTNGFFSDFTLLAASSLYSDLLKENIESVELRNKWEKIDLAAHAYSTEFGV